MRKIPIVIGLLYGDEGKGTTVSFLCSERHVDYVLRFSGGPQTAHNVVTDTGLEHTFSQFGSGTFHGAGTILSEFMLVNPFNFIVESDALSIKIGHDPMENSYISENALLVTPIHMMANHQREINRGGNPHGSCGEGVGEARGYAIHKTPDNPIVIGDMRTPGLLINKLITLKEELESEIEGFLFNGNIEDLAADYWTLLKERSFNIVSDQWISEKLADEKLSFVFEGSQGVLLDESYGFHPHTTWSDVTDTKARLLIDRAGLDSNAIAETIGVMRTYTTRHGYGPFPSEFTEDYDEWIKRYPEKHNTWGRFQGSWRGGFLDLSLLKYSLTVLDGVDMLSVTHCDIPLAEVVTQWEENYTSSHVKDRPHQIALTELLNAFRSPHTTQVHSVDELITLLENELESPVGILSYGPADKDKERR